MAAQLVMAGVGVAQTIGQFKQAEVQAEFQEKMQEYNNSMVNISNAINQNTITNNLNQQLAKFTREAVTLQAEELSSVASAEVAAAAAGVQGNSVDATIRDIQSNAAAKRYNRSVQRTATITAADQARQNSNLAAAMQQDYSPIADPDPMAALLGFASSDAGKGLGSWANKKYDLGF